VANICEYSGRGDGDLAICRTLLEHVENVEHALLGMHSILKPGGKLLIFVPSRNAVFARLNLLLPHVLKRKILFFLYPYVAEAQGFPAYYDRCTPRQIETLAKKSRFTISEVRLYYISKYFDFFAPLYLLWRLWILAFYAVSPCQAAETFSMVLKKTDD
jgi:2-polyprenyl-6-hydroxyphenyl methylase/3-demethylubiquinone-9 3-methyltransferase